MGTSWKDKAPDASNLDPIPKSLHDSFINADGLDQISLKDGFGRQAPKKWKKDWEDKFGYGEYDSEKSLQYIKAKQAGRPLSLAHAVASLASSQGLDSAKRGKNVDSGFEEGEEEGYYDKQGYWVDYSDQEEYVEEDRRHDPRRARSAPPARRRADTRRGYEEEDEGYYSDGERDTYTSPSQRLRAKIDSWEYYPEDPVVEEVYDYVDDEGYEDEGFEDEGFEDGGDYEDSTYDDRPIYRSAPPSTVGSRGRSSSRGGSERSRSAGRTASGRSSSAPPSTRGRSTGGSYSTDRSRSGQYRR